MSVLNEIREKYAKTEKVVDKYGRIITVGLLTTSKRTMVRKWAGTDDVVVLAPMTFAAAVRAINDLPYTFPRSEVELQAVMDMLDDDAIISIAQAYDKLTPKTTEEEDLEAAKNLPATSS